MARGQELSNRLAASQEIAHAITLARLVPVPPTTDNVVLQRAFPLRLQTYTLFTEGYAEDSPRRRQLVALVRTRFGLGATIEFGVGVWQGQQEHSARITLVTDLDYDAPVLQLAEDITRGFGQDGVLVTVTPAVGRLVVPRR